MSDASIVAVSSVREFFERAVRTAISRHDLEPEPATAGYLVDVLCDYAQRPADLEEPLSVLIARARRRLGTQRMRQLKRVGDHSLYVAGYFRPSLQRRRLDLDYYREMGGTAYRRLSLMLRRQRQASRLRAVYTELADDFSQFVDVLAKVRSHTEPGQEQPAPLGRAELEVELRAAGVVIGPTPDGKGGAN